MEYWRYVFEFHSRIFDHQKGDAERNFALSKDVHNFVQMQSAEFSAD